MGDSYQRELNRLACDLLSVDARYLAKLAHSGATPCDSDRRDASRLGFTEVESFCLSIVRQAGKRGQL